MNLKDLKVIFMGTPEFSLDVLEMLINNCNVIGVVTQPDKIVGRDKDKSYTPVKKLALEHNIKVIQPEKIRKEYQEVIDMNADMIVTCAFGQIIPEVILNNPKYGCINVHASLLPYLRGGSPLHHSIIDGYSKTGVTIMHMDKGMDTGNIITQREIDILDTDNVGTIHDKLKVIGAELLLETLPSIIDGTAPSIKQDDSLVTICHNITHDEEKIDFNKNAREIFNQVRGMNPFPVSYLEIDKVIYKIYNVSYEEKELNYQNGEVINFDKKGFSIKCNNGLINILDLKKEGKKRMLIKDYLNGEKEELKGKVVKYER